MVDQLRSFAAEVTRVAREVGTEGKLGGQADVQGVAGTWKDLTDSVNLMASNLTSQVRNIADVTKAVAAGNLSEKITVDVKGEILELKATINTMVDQLSSFAAEVTRVAREVGTEGRLGGQAQVRGVSGTWKDLTDNVNFMAGNLTGQVRGIAKVVTAVANGDLKQKLTVEAKGEIAALAETINSMTDTLATFAEQVTTVAREVGVEGKLGGQAKVPGAAGTWKGLTENVNELAANLTTQVRAIAEVATAVTQGDLTRSITVETQGEVATLKDTINEMIRNLKDTTQKNTEQDWLKTNLAKFSRMLQGQRDLVTVGQLILSELAPVVGAQQAEFYVVSSVGEASRLKLLASYASGGQTVHGKEVDLGQGLVGQCALDKRKILLTNTPSQAFRIASGLSEHAALDVLVLPIVFEGHVRGVLELASLEHFNPVHEGFLDQLTESIGIVINTIEANTRTEDLLKQSQSLAEELGSRQEELQTTNQELQNKARLLAHQNQEVERKNTEVEQARQALEEKAEQLALDVQVQERVPGQHVARAAHAAELAADPVGPVVQEPRWQPVGQAGRVRQDDPLVRQRPADADQRHPRPVEDRVGHGGGRCQRAAPGRSAPLDRTRFPPLRRVQARGLRGATGAAAAARDGHRRETPAADHQEPAVQRVQVHPRGSGHVHHLARGQRLVERQRRAEPRQPGAGVLGGRHRHRHLRRQAADHLRGVPAGRRLDLAQVRRHRPRPGDQPRTLAPARRRDQAGQRARPRQRVHAVPAAELQPAAQPAPRPQRAVRTHRAVGAHRRASDAAGAPVAPVAPYFETVTATEPPVVFANAADDDRDDIATGDRVMLIVENEIGFAKVMLDAARACGFKGLVTGTGASALTMTREFLPSVITLDIHLPDMEGWRILDRLKTDLVTRHIPICVVSTDDARDRALQAGAIGFVAKPLQSADEVHAALGQLASYVDRPVKRLAVVMPPSPLRTQLLEGLDSDVDAVVASNADRSAGRARRRRLRGGRRHDARLRPRRHARCAGQALGRVPAAAGGLPRRTRRAARRGIAGTARSASARRIRWRRCARIWRSGCIAARA